MLHKDGKAAVAKLTGLVKRGGVFWFRVRVPTDLVPVLKKREITRSLRTSDRKEAEFIASAERLKVQLEFDSHRRGLSRSPSFQTLRELRGEDIQRLVHGWFYELERNAIQADDSSKVRRGSLEHRDMVIELREDMATMQAELAGDNHPSDPLWAEKPLRDLLSANGLNAAVNDESRGKLRRLILRGLIEASRRMQDRASGTIQTSERDPYFANVDGDLPAPPPKPVSGMKLRELLAQFLGEQSPKNLRSKTLAHYRMVVSRFEEVLGPDTPITDITRQHCITFRDLLAKMPANASKRYRGLKLQQVANAAPKETTLSARSVNKMVESLSALLAYAEDCDLIRKNYARKLRLSTDGPKQDRTFNDDQLQTLFAAPVFQTYRLSGEKNTKNARFWVPLIGLFSGMRQNEICQLYVEDIKSESGIPYFAVREELDDGTPAPDKHLKTKNAWRRVPIHPELLRLGFLHLVELKKAAGAKRVFDELPYSAGENYSDAFQKWFSRLLHQTGVTESKRVTFHGLRHTFRDALRKHDVPKEYAQALGGWDHDTSLSEHYGKGFPLESLKREIAKVAYAGVTLPRPERS